MQLDFLSLPDGTRISTSNGKVVRIPTTTEAQKIVSSTRRKLADLPAPPANMPAIAVTICYELFGLDDSEIAIATGLSADQLDRVKATQAYEKMKDTIVEQILSAQGENIRQLFAAHSKDAVGRIVDLMQNGELEQTQLFAAKDILDRAGHRPADIKIEQTLRQQAELTIHIVDDTDDKVIDAIPQPTLSLGAITDVVQEDAEKSEKADEQ